MNGERRLYGIVAQFSTASALLQGVRTARAAGYVRLDAYSPMPVKGLAASLGFKKDRLSLIALLGGIVGAVSTYALQSYSVSSAYPLNVGGRTPLWPGLIPATFEMAVLGAALAAFFGMLFASGLPKLHHAMFEVSEFDRASRDGFFLCVLAVDPCFNAQKTRRLLEQLHPLNIIDVAESEP